MHTRTLDENGFRKTFIGRMRDVTDDAAPVADIWPYVAAIPRSDLGGRRFLPEVVEFVYRSGDEAFDHVLIPTSEANVYLVVVVDRRAKTVFGHHILNLREKYGLDSDP